MADEVQLPKGYEGFKPAAAAPTKIQLSPTAGQLPLGFESYVPQTKSDVEGTVAPYLGRLTANSLPALGSLEGPVGTGAGTAASIFLRSTFPKVFGQAPTDAGEMVGEFGKDLLVNNVVPAGIGKVVNAGVRLAGTGLRAGAAYAGRALPGVRGPAAEEITNQILNQYQQPASQILESGAKTASGKLGDLRSEIKLQGQLHPPTSVTGPGGQQTVQFSPEVQAAMKDLEDTFGKNQVGQKLVTLQRQIDAGADVAGNQTYNQIQKTALSDLTHVRNWKLAAGEQGIEDLAINKLLGNLKEGTLDSKAILSELSGPNKEIYGEAISPGTMSNFKDLVNEIHAQQTGHGNLDAVVRYSKGRIIWTTALAGGGLHGLMGLPGATAASITLTNSLLSKAMENPETARIVVEAMRTPAGSQKGQIINQVLGNIWKGTADVTSVPEK